MTEHNTSSRRDFLATAATTAAAGAMITGCASTGGRKLEVLVGPNPVRVKPSGPIRIGLIGVGGRCKDLLWASAANKTEIDVRAIADPNEENIKARMEFINQHWKCSPDVYHGQTDYRDKLLARDDLDAVLVATPCNLHAEMYLACFAAGKHFYGEKPMCIELDEVNAICKAQETNPDVICQIGFQRRSSKVYQAAIQAIHDGKIGDPFEALGAWRISGGPLGMPGSGTQIWFGRREQSGDWMLEQACHTWDIFCWVAGDMPVAASGRGRRWLFKEQDPQRDVTDFYVAHLEFPNGMVADFEHNWMCPRHDESALFNGIFERFTGPKGGIALGLYPTSVADFYPRADDAKPEKFAEQVPEPTRESIDAFYNALRTNTKPPSGVENGRMATLTGMLVRKAVYDNRRVTMKELLRG